MNQQTPAVSLRGLTKSFDFGERGVEVLRGIDLEVQRGEFVAVMGPSGSGKSTLLHLIGALDLPATGSIRLEGTELASLSDDALTLARRRRRTPPCHSSSTASARRKRGRHWNRGTLAIAAATGR